MNYKIDPDMFNPYRRFMDQYISNLMLVKGYKRAKPGLRNKTIVVKSYIRKRHIDFRPVLAMPPFLGIYPHADAKISSDKVTEDK